MSSISISSSAAATSGSGLPSIDPFSGSSGGAGQSANYFFGFLITFAVLLVVFVIAGLLSRRRMQARQAAAMDQIGAGDPWVFGYNVRGEYGRRFLVPPIWMERWVEDPEGAKEEEKGDIDNGSVPEKEKWKNIMPLCATLTRPEITEKTDECLETEKKVRRSSVSTISSWFSSFGATKDNGTVCEVESPLPVVSEASEDMDTSVSLVVMIAMPRGPQSRGYEFGVACVPVTVIRPEDTPNVP